ncbi:MAG: transporter substrate-binding domain-containing protein [Gammaproteobacteria bacterium]|nr:transporter substrate-binding domain-containing protein [Gammaproteobacteria bacterium]
MFIKSFRAICLLLAASTLAAPTLAATSLQLVTSEFPPYTTASLPNQGVVSEIVAEACKRSGYALTVKILPWTQALESGKEATADGIVGIYHNKEREQWFVYSDPIVPNQIGFYKRVESPITYNALSDLKPYRIGTVRGYSNPKSFTDANLTIDEVPDDETNLRNLANKQFDLTLIDKGVAEYIINNKFPDLKPKLVWIEPPIEKLLLYVAISKKTPDYDKKLAGLNRGLREMVKDGTMRKIINKAGI